MDPYQALRHTIATHMVIALPMYDMFLFSDPVKVPSVTSITSPSRAAKMASWIGG